MSDKPKELKTYDFGMSETRLFVMKLLTIVNLTSYCNDAEYEEKMHRIIVPEIYL